MENVAVEIMDELVIQSESKRQHYKNLALGRVGETRINNHGSLMILDEYNNSADIWVRFPQGNMVHTSYQQFVSGKVKNVYDRSKYGIGFIGEGDYKISIDGVFTPQYLAWSSMLMRAYSHVFHRKQPTYKGCTVAEEWHNFQNFAKWYDENYYEVEGQRTHLDKDILLKGNKVYSSETCVFVPQSINSLFIKRQGYRGEYPLGVKPVTRAKNKFEAQCRNNTGKRIYLGYFNTPEEAFNAYKVYKEQLIKDIAEEYKKQIPHTLYDAMLAYTVDIND